MGSSTTAAVGGTVGGKGVKLSHLSYYKAIKQQYLNNPSPPSNDIRINLITKNSSSHSQLQAKDHINCKTISCDFGLWVDR